ncbi:N-6 DNA methylase [Hyphomicrobium sp.]|uniref:N-6 DNA methylase n=1 Tax=Hyphomicrobium sp. TaxID=82 RepID=UPI001D998CD8|nr:N-6 DNA methylase [Hyphomicrobium sp.]MBY0560050.1 SAM-dependent methyltransferase [Hyphomicrobium sp.]
MARSTAQKVAPASRHKARSREFLELVGKISMLEGWREYDALTKWLEAATCALRNPVLRTIGDKLTWDENEARYMKIVHSCRHPDDTMGAMSKMLAVAQLALDEEPSDFIGPMFMEVAANSHVGQFFTPHELSIVAARMTMANPRDMLEAVMKDEGRDHLMLCEPACGVGGMVLAANQVMREFNLDPARHAHWVCTDIDLKAVCGAYIQLTLTDTSAVVVHGNTITREMFDVLITAPALRYPKRKLHPDHVVEPALVE